MIQVINSSRDPYFNLALEEYALTQMDPQEKYLILWQNQPAVVVGRNQNTYAEVNEEVVKTKDICVVRRLSGGGAVYHDPGNLNFTFIVNESNQSVYDFRKFTRPIIKALAKIGVDALDNSRNDITIEGRKFSGNAQYRFRNRLLHHGTILVNTRFDDMEAVLNVNTDKMASKGIKSVRSRVTNINEHLATPVSVEQFKEILTEIIAQEEGDVFKYNLTPEDMKQIEQLRKKKYSAWAWNYGISPRFNVKKSATFEWGSIEFQLEVKKGKIIRCKIYGDFFADEDISLLEQHLTGISYNNKAFKQALQEINLLSFLPQADKAQILSMLSEYNP